jgi:predicted dinucleotide-binding enzyme
MSAQRSVIGIVGGTGKLGAALARRWAQVGFPLVIGSRDAARAAGSGLDWPRAWR